MFNNEHKMRPEHPHLGNEHCYDHLYMVGFRV